MTSPAPEPPSPLFRAEALAEQRDHWMGRVVVVPRAAHSLAVGLVAVLAGGVLGILILGEHTRTEQLAGWLGARGDQGSGLEARLYGPGEAIGAMRPGQPVRLRYDAFPHPRFGQRDGLVRRISPADLSPAEIAGITRDPELVRSGPLFRVDVELIDPERLPLLATMTLEGEVTIETRPIWKWVLGLDDMPGHAAEESP